MERSSSSSPDYRPSALAAAAAAIAICALAFTLFNGASAVPPVPPQPASRPAHLTINLVVGAPEPTSAIASADTAPGEPVDDTEVIESDAFLEAFTDADWDS